MKTWATIEKNRITVHIDEEALTYMFSSEIAYCEMRTRLFDDVMKVINEESIKRERGTRK